MCRYYSGENLIDIVRLLIDNRIEVNAKTKYGSNPFLLLFQNVDLGYMCVLNVARLLIEKKIDTTVVNSNGDNALTLACQYHKGEELGEIIRFILNNSSIDINAKNKQGSAKFT